MERRKLFLGTLALAAVLLGTSTARANLISWGYNWAPGSPTVTTGTGGVSFSNEPSHVAVGTSVVVASNLDVFSSAKPGKPDTFGALQGNYSLTVTLTDIATSSTGSLTFTGQLQGNFSNASANVTNTFTGPTTQAITIGNTVFTVTMGYYPPPGPPGSLNHGSIAATVAVAPGDHIARVPEPSTMALAGIGVGLAGLGAWRRRRRPPA
jgi:hypothetical protein